MTDRASLGLRNYSYISTKAFVISTIAIAALITAMSAPGSIGERSVNAQMMGDHGRGWAGNMTSGQQQQHEQKTINNGTINLEQVIFQAIKF